MAANNFFQKWLKNILSRSITIEFGIPCLLMISSTNFSATCFAVNGCFKVMKCAILLNRSTTTMILSKPPTLGNPSMKSMVQSSRIRLAMVMVVIVQQGRVLQFYSFDIFRTVQHNFLHHSSCQPNVFLHSYACRFWENPNSPPTPSHGKYEATQE